MKRGDYLVTIDEKDNFLVMQWTISTINLQHIYYTKQMSPSL